MQSGKREISSGKDAFESNIHSFIIRVWLEETNEKTGRTALRGHLTHVPSGKRQYIKDLSEIPSLIAFYLGIDGLKANWWNRMKQWLRIQKR